MGEETKETSKTNKKSKSKQRFEENSKETEKDRAWNKYLRLEIFFLPTFNIIKLQTSPKR